MPLPIATTLRDGYAHACCRFRTTVHHLGGLAVRNFREFAGSAENPGVRKVSWSLSPVSSSVPDARHLVRGQLAAWGADRQSEIVELLTSELVTNTLRHAWGPILLVLSFQDGTLRCEVEDANPALPGLRNARDDEEGGRGLLLLDLLSQRWGSDHTPTGKTTWFELPVHASPDAPRRPGTRMTDPPEAFPDHPEAPTR
ncbi:ATP-binding protein [Streptosporangium lutulentum]|uniref:Histidine kinase/HSP90-like ATPase domain-containing protein n=1 Tax=Streptosporangium lutulentum TaxID=1461250 RepID=A0ABT9QID3_9ACTN|nr:ATP-binding protein [Streptosporangium lutulentum]MDP9846523.1 hypothetical protein [Streptosporangium lutulentum]